MSTHLMGLLFWAAASRWPPSSFRRRRAGGEPPFGQVCIALLSVAGPAVSGGGFVGPALTPGDISITIARGDFVSAPPAAARILSGCVRLKVMTGVRCAYAGESRLIPEFRIRQFMTGHALHAGGQARWAGEAASSNSAPIGPAQHAHEARSSCPPCFADAAAPQPPYLTEPGRTPYHRCFSDAFAWGQKLRFFKPRLVLAPPPSLRRWRSRAFDRHSIA